MAGHSKWSNIKHKKAAADAKRGKIFTRLAREITVAARLGGGDKESNPRLRSAIAAALSQNMTKEAVDRAVKKGTGDDASTAALEEIRYEGYGPGGVAFLVDCMTDNKNRTVAEVRHAFSKAGGNLGTSGSVAFMFEKKGIFTIGADHDEDSVLEAALEAGADDLETDEEGYKRVTCPPDVFSDVYDALKAADFEILSAQVSMEAETKAKVDDALAEKTFKLIDRLEDLDDTQNVYTNAEFTDAQLEAYGE